MQLLKMNPFRCICSLILIGFTLFELILSDADDIMVLRSKSFNTLSQLELTGEHKDIVMDFIQGTQAIDLGIQIAKKNISTQVQEPTPPLTITTQDVLQMQGCLMGHTEKLIYQAVLTDDILYIKSPLVNLPGGFVLQSSNIQGLENVCQSVTAGTKVECKYKRFLHTALGQLDHFVLEMSRVETILDLEGKVVNITEASMLASFFLEGLVHNRTVVRYSQSLMVAASSLRAIVDTKEIGITCNHSSLATVVRNYTQLFGGYHNADIFIMKWCSSSGMVPTDTKSTPVEVFKITLRSKQTNFQSTMTFVGKFDSYQELGNSQTQFLKLLWILQPGAYIVMVNQERIVSLAKSTLIDSLLTMADNFPIIRMNLLKQASYSAAYCNQVTSTESSCVAEIYSSNPSAVTFYQAVELLSLDNNIVLLSLPSFVESELSIKSAIVTKNYLLMRTDQDLFACYKKYTENLRLLSSDSSQKASCTQLDIKSEDQCAYALSALVLEENQSNDIDGYILVGLKNLKIPENSALKANGDLMTIDIRSFLITGPYYVFKLDTYLASSVCQRYLSDCENTYISFKTQNQVKPNANLLQKNPIIKNVFVLGGTFSSVLERTGSKKLTTTKSSGIYGFSLSKFFLGDILEPYFTKPVGFAYEKHLTATNNKNHYATFSKKFIYSIPRIIDPNLFIQEQKGASLFKIDWVFIKYNSDNTFMFAMNYLFMEEDVSYLRTSKLKYAIELRPTSINLGSIFFGDFTTPAKSMYKNLLPIHNTDNDSVDIIHVDDQSYLGEWVVSAFQFDKDNSFQDSQLGSLALSVLPEEKFRTVRTRISEKDDLFAIVTDKSVYICKFAKDLNREIKLLAVIHLDDLIKSETALFHEILDVLSEDNVLILDVEVFHTQTAEYVSRIYIYNLDITKETVYLYGYISLSSRQVGSGYMLYYSKSVDKAILVCFGKAKTVVEYSLDNIFLESSKLGNEITNDTWSVFDTYRGLKIVEFIAVGPRSAFNSFQKRRTLAVTNEGSYMILARAFNQTSGDKQVLVLLGKVTHVVLSVFKSELLVDDPDHMLLIPETITDLQKISYMPLAIINKKTGAIELVFFWKEDFLELHYRRIFNGDHSCNSSNSSFKEIMTLEFKDSSGKLYVETFTMEKEDKFSINPVFSINKTSLTIDSEKTGLIESFGLDCGNSHLETVGKIIRNMSQSVVCQHDDKYYNITFLNSISKTSILDLESDWKEVRDIVPLKAPSSNMFVVLEARRILIVKSVRDSLKQSVILTSGSKDYNFTECALIMNAQLIGTSIEISILCNNKDGAEEWVYLVNYAQVQENERTGKTIKMMPEFPNKHFGLPEKIWIAASTSKTNVAFTDVLVFARHQVFLFSVGDKYVLDLYYFNINATSSTSRYSLVSTLFYEKYSELDLVSFQATKFAYPSKQPQFSLILLFAEKHSTKLRVNYQLIKFYNQSIVEIMPGKILNVNIKNSKGDEGLVLHSEAFVTERKENSTGGYMNITHTFYIVTDDSAIEFSVYETNTKFGTAVLSSSSQQIKDSIVHYNYVGLCESGVEFRLRQTKEYLLFNCMPTAFDSTSNNLMVYKRDLANRKKPYVNPIFALSQLIGYTPKNSVQEIFKGEDGLWRILKSTPRGLLELFSVYSSPQILVSLQNGDMTEKQFRVLMSNNYEVQSVSMIINNRSWHDLSFSWMFKGIISDVTALTVIGSYILMLVIGMNIHNFKNLWLRFKRYKRHTKGFRVLRLTQELPPSNYEQNDEDTAQTFDNMKHSFFAKPVSQEERQLNIVSSNSESMISYLLNDLVL